MLSGGGGQGEIALFMTDLLRGIITGYTGIEGEETLTALTTQAITNAVHQQGLGPSLRIKRNRKEKEKRIKKVTH